MKRLVLLICILCSIEVATATTYPQLALGGGYQCVVIISNKFPDDFTGALRLRTGYDQPWATPVKINGKNAAGLAEFQIQIPAEGTEKFVIEGDNTVRAGYLEIIAKPASAIQNLTVSFFFNFFVAKRLTDSTGVPEATWSTRFTLPVERGNGVNTGFAWAPAYHDGKSFDIEVSLFDEEGHLIDSKDLTFDGHRASFFTEVFSGVPDPFVGRMAFKGSRDFYLTGLRLTMIQGGFQLTSTPPR